MDHQFEKISFRTSKFITRAYSTSFSMAVSLLSPDMKTAIYNIYGFVRLADEIVDSFHSTDQEYLFNHFEKELYYAIDNGASTNPVLYAFAVTVKKYNIPGSHIQSFMKSMRHDLTKKDYKSFQETEEYIFGSANVVGLMCLYIFVRGNKNMYDDLKDPAMKLGSAFQKVNFLRDLKNDYQILGRSYFAGVKPGSFNESIKGETIANIRADFQMAVTGIKKLPGRSRLAVWLAYRYYSHLLKKIHQTPVDELMLRRIRISNFKKLFLLVQCYFQYKFRLI